MKGGESRNLVKGDVMVVPAGTAHWFKAVPDHVSYFVVKVIQP
jgi:quercetin dioxygenase-like cupin family protein